MTFIRFVLSIATILTGASAFANSPTCQLSIVNHQAVKDYRGGIYEYITYPIEGKGSLVGDQLSESDLIGLEGKGYVVRDWLDFNSGGGDNNYGIVLGYFCPILTWLYSCEYRAQIMGIGTSHFSYKKMEASRGATASEAIANLPACLARHDMGESVQYVPDNGKYRRY